ncbi:bifunctional transcriptional activator/DNA repair enzyme AdaA [Paenibacillus allorhizosphaerae]|nr:bifunctional transcriptional activator/DNA repair enzyme AdaA [Paenibacillus allorhizosphaerae]
MTDEAWRAIVGNDASFDGIFYYAVKTTGIFCRPSCKSRVPNKANVRVFQYALQALEAQFRPCKRCRPDGLRLPDEEWVMQIEQWVEEHYSETLTLGKVADLFHGSPYHLHRTFKRIKGITLAEHIQQTRIARAMMELTATNRSVMDIAVAVGIPNAAHFATVFQKKTGLTPTQYREAASAMNQKPNGGMERGAN